MKSQQTQRADQRTIRDQKDLLRFHFLVACSLIQQRIREQAAKKMKPQQIPKADQKRTGKEKKY
jgi:hypothetical protein